MVRNRRPVVLRSVLSDAVPFSSSGAAFHIGERESMDMRHNGGRSSLLESADSGGGVASLTLSRKFCRWVCARRVEAESECVLGGRLPGTRVRYYLPQHLHQESHFPDSRLDSTRRLPDENHRRIFLRQPRLGIFAGAGRLLPDTNYRTHARHAKVPLTPAGTDRYKPHCPRM